MEEKRARVLSPFGRKDKILVEEEVFEAEINYQDAHQPDVKEGALVAACSRALRDGIYSNTALEQIYGKSILAKAHSYGGKSEPLSYPERERRADQILNEAAASLRRLHSCYKRRPSLLHTAFDGVEAWARIALPAALFLMISLIDHLVRRNDASLYHKIAVALLVVLANLMLGCLFYFTYYHVIHRYVIRNLTNRMFGSPIYWTALEALRMDGVETSKLSSIALQNIIAQFFYVYKLRSKTLFLKSTIYHFYYMGSLIIGLYLAAQSIVDDRYARLIVIFGLFAISFVAVMWLDRKFGEREESEIINENRSLFVDYVKDHASEVDGRAKELISHQ